MVLGCTRSTYTVWKEGKYTVVAAAGIKQRKERMAEILCKELPEVKPDMWGCIQASQLWYVHICIQKKEKERVGEQERKSERERKTEKVWEEQNKRARVRDTEIPSDKDLQRHSER